MIWDIPDWWAFTLIALAVYRLFRLLADDTILDRPRGALFRRLNDESKWGFFILCPWCLGAWLAIGWWFAWELWPHASLLVATPFAISAIVGLIASNLEPD